MKIIIVLLLLAGSVYSQNEQIEKEQLVRQHIVNDQIEQLSKMFYAQQIEIIKGEYPELPDSIWTEVDLNINEQDRLLNETIKLYCDFFTLEELRDIEKAMSLPGMKKLNDFQSNESYNQKFGEMGVKAGQAILEKIEAYLTQMNIKK